MNSQPHEQQEHVQKEANPPEIAQLEETLTTVRLRISSMTRGQKDWRLCWASLLPAVPKLPSVDMLETGRKKKKGKGLVLREGCGSQRHADSLRIPGTQEGASLAKENWQRSASAGPGNNVKDTHSLPKCLDLILFGFSKKNI